jgi:amidohydrolase
MAEIVTRAATAVVGAEKVTPGVPWMASEDFSLFLNERPGCYFFIGSRNEEAGLIWDHHHPKFNFDEEALAVGTGTMTQTALEYFASVG